MITQKDDEIFENFTKFWIWNAYVDGDVKVRDHYHVTGNYTGSAHRDRNINVKLNRKIPIAFHNPKNYDSHYIMQELGKFDFKISVVPNELEKYTSFKSRN